MTRSLPDDRISSGLRTLSMWPKDCTFKKYATQRPSTGRSPTAAIDPMKPVALSLLASIFDALEPLPAGRDRENAWLKTPSLPMMRDKVTKATARARWTARCLNRASDTCRVKPKLAALKKGKAAQKYRTLLGLVSHS